MSDLTEFLLARITEDETAARSAATLGADWHLVNAHGWDAPFDGERLVSRSAKYSWDDLVTPAAGEHGDYGLSGAEAEHIARHDPARVLAECEAKRRIVDEHQQTHRSSDYAYPEGYIDPCITCGQIRPRKFPCLTLRALALPYADHPDYRAEWKP